MLKMPLPASHIHVSLATEQTERHGGAEGEQEHGGVESSNVLQADGWC